MGNIILEALVDHARRADGDHLFVLVTATEEVLMHEADTNERFLKVRSRRRAPLHYAA